MYTTYASRKPAAGPLAPEKISLFLIHGIVVHYTVCTMSSAFNIANDPPNPPTHRSIHTTNPTYLPIHCLHVLERSSSRLRYSGVITTCTVHVAYIHRNRADGMLREFYPYPGTGLLSSSRSRLQRTVAQLKLLYVPKRALRMASTFQSAGLQ